MQHKPLVIIKPQTAKTTDKEAQRLSYQTKGAEIETNTKRKTKTQIPNEYADASHNHDQYPRGNNTCTCIESQESNNNTRESYMNTGESYNNTRESYNNTKESYNNRNNIIQEPSYNSIR